MASDAQLPSKSNDEPAATGHSGWCLYRLDCERRVGAPRSCNCGVISLSDYVRRSMQWDWTILDREALSQIQHSLRSALSGSHETSDQRCSACGHVELFKGAKVLKWPDLGGGTLEAVSSDVLGMRMAVEASAALERTKRRAIDCPHERASIKCPDCGIDLVAHKDGES